ncbi:hypothetical protein [Streptomyces sp. NPDC057682]|uniref:hypothetical protein n=1 Tax=Streptomyces sp. NPDC057682 TaxID=3346210 RepID=UPI0036A3F4DB
MRRQILGPSGRRGTALVASAAVLCLGGVLAGCGGGTGGDGYTAVGAAGASGGKPSPGAGAPSGEVTLIPLDGKRADGGRPGASPDGGGPGPSGSADGSGRTDGGTSASGGADGPGAGSARSGGSGGAASGSGGGTGPGAGAGTGGGAGAGGGDGAGGSASGGGAGGGGDSGGSGSASGGDSGGAGGSSPSVPGPAVLEVGEPVRAAGDVRWCEKVTVGFRNTGGTEVRSGTVTFATHIIGGLGIDWATRESTAPLPAPIGAGAARKETYTVCVDAWRVPLGMRIETRDVTADWK